MPRRFALLPVVALFTVSGAYAQQSSNPWYVGIQQTFGHEENVHVTSAGNSDNFSTTTLRGGVNTLLGRQRVFADASVFSTRYNRNDDLDYNGHNVRAGVDWATVGNLSGTVVGGSTKRLVRLTVPDAAFDPAVPDETRSPVQRVDSFDASARLGTGAALAIDAGYGHRRLSYDDPNAFVAAEEYKQNEASLGVSYAFSGALRMGTGLHAEETQYSEPDPRRPTAPPDRSKRRGLYVSANWLPTASSTVNTRLSFGKTEYDVFTERDSSGVTGYVSWDWKPTAKLGFITSLSRDTGRDFQVQRVAAGTVDPTTPTQFDPITGDLLTTTAFSRTSTTLSLRGNWAATAKIGVDAGFSYQRSSLSTGRSANSRAMVVGANWAPTRSLSLGCDYAQELRSGESDPKTFSCFGQFLLQ